MSDFPSQIEVLGRTYTYTDGNLYKDGKLYRRAVAGIFEDDTRVGQQWFRINGQKTHKRH